jgi:hypothetical protein
MLSNRSGLRLFKRALAHVNHMRNTPLTFMPTTEDDRRQLLTRRRLTRQLRLGTSHGFFWALTVSRPTGFTHLVTAQGNFD